MAKQYHVELDLEILNETEDALRITDGDLYCWVPKGLIQNYDEEDFLVGKTPVFLLPIWFAEKEGLI
jgi:hypothetical protein